MDFSFYSVENVTSQVKYLPNTHYSGVNGMVKILLPQVLPASLEKVICLDLDVVLSLDVAELWDFFSAFTDKQVLYFFSKVRSGIQ